VSIAVHDVEKPGVERVPARRVGENVWCLVQSPLYATEVVYGDVIRIVDESTGLFEMVERGGNVGVQLYLAAEHAHDEDATARVAKELGRVLKPVGGRVEAHTAGLVALSLPVRVGFVAVEGILSAMVAEHPGAQWQYTNVYDAVTGEPLGWWDDRG
jgi:hypothetical protein